MSSAPALSRYCRGGCTLLGLILVVLGVDLTLLGMDWAAISLLVSGAIVLVLPGISGPAGLNRGFGSWLDWLGEPSATKAEPALPSASPVIEQQSQGC